MFAIVALENDDRVREASLDMAVALVNEQNAKAEDDMFMMECKSSLARENLTSILHRNISNTDFEVFGPHSREKVCVDQAHQAAHVLERKMLMWLAKGEELVHTCE